MPFFQFFGAETSHPLDLYGLECCVPQAMLRSLTFVTGRSFKSKDEAESVSKEADP